MAEYNSLPDPLGNLLDDMFQKPLLAEEVPKEEEPPMWFSDVNAPFADWLFEDE